MKCMYEPLNVPPATSVCVKYCVLRAVWLSTEDFCDLMLYCWACGFLSFEGSWCLLLQGSFIILAF